MKRKIPLVVFVMVLLVSAWLFRDVKISLSFLQFGENATKDGKLSDGEVARVSRVIDGDTIVLDDGRHVRYVGINAPEIAHDGQGAQCYGEEAKEKNRELVEGKEVRLVRDVSERDKYGRSLYFVFVGDVFVEEILMREGYARHMFIKPDITRADEIGAWEREAKERRLGLWGAC